MTSFQLKVAMFVFTRALKYLQGQYAALSKEQQEEVRKITAMPPGEAWYEKKVEP